eukprot:365126-Chlamydomonas_euryale.AAC.23
MSSNRNQRGRSRATLNTRGGRCEAAPQSSMVSIYQGPLPCQPSPPPASMRPPQRPADGRRPTAVCSGCAPAWALQRVVEARRSRLQDAGVRWCVHRSHGNAQAMRPCCLAVQATDVRRKSDVSVSTQSPYLPASMGAAAACVQRADCHSQAMPCKTASPGMLTGAVLLRPSPLQSSASCSHEQLLLLLLLWPLSGQCLLWGCRKFVHRLLQRAPQWKRRPPGMPQPACRHSHPCQMFLGLAQACIGP